MAQEIAPFRLTGVESHVTVRYVRDGFSNSDPGVGATPGVSSQTQSNLREELFVMTHSYVYHPNLLSLDIGGGPILQHGSFIAGGEETRSGTALYNFTGRATFLRDKPYQGTLFYDHLNPTLNVAPGQVMTQQNSRFGVDLSLKAPVTPVPLFLEATRQHTQGRSDDRIIDDQVDRFNLKADHSYGALGSTVAQYQNTQQVSKSGSPNLAIQTSNSESEGISVDSRFQFGDKRQYDLTNVITYDTQAYALEGQNAIPERKAGRFALDARGRHSKELQSYGRYSYGATNQGDLNSVAHLASAGLIYAPQPDVSISVGAHGDKNRSSQLRTNSRGVESLLHYQRKLPLGVAQASYGLRYDRHAHNADADQTGVIGEFLTLVGTDFVALGHEHVSPGSIVVSNATRSQTYIEGIDYALTLIGAETRLQRLIGGAIVDGQELLVDYSYELGGTFAYDQLDQTLNLNWSLLSYVDAYARYFDSSPRLTSGTPDFPLNVIQSSLYGVRADVPFKEPTELTLGGSMEREVRHETISPFRRAADEVHVQIEDPFFKAGNIRVSAHRTRVDYVNGTQNVDLHGYDARYWARLPLGINLSADASYEKDVGGLVPRERVVTTIAANWRYRKVYFSVDFGRTVETQGGLRRSRTLLQCFGRRDF